jgi:hypothetical protein
VESSRVRNISTGFHRIIKSFDGGLGETLQSFSRSRRMRDYG